MSEESRTKEDVLPVEVIHHIQSLLPLEKAVNTCMLSKSWLHAWYTIPTFRIRIKDPTLRDPASRDYKWISTDEKATTFNKLIHTALQRYHRDNMPIESFHLDMDITGNYEDVKNWIRLAVSTGYLKELSLDIGVFRNETFTLPNEIFSSQNLHIIRVIHINCHSENLSLPIFTNPQVINCVSLRILELFSITITAYTFHKLLSTCTLLEKITLLHCECLKNVKVKNLLHLSKLKIESMKRNDICEISNVPRLCSFHYHATSDFRKPIPFQIDSLARVTQLHIGGVIIDDSFFKTIESEFSVLESLTLVIDFRKDESMVITSVSLKWLTLRLVQSGPVINIQVYAPRLLSFNYSGTIPGLLFRTTPPEEVKLYLNSREHLGVTFFLKMRDILNSSSKFYLYIKSDILNRLVPLKIDVDDLRRRVLLPIGNVQLTLETCLDESIWKQSRFFDAFFLICHPSYISCSSLAIMKIMEGNNTDLKEVQMKNPFNGNWEPLKTPWESLLYRLAECKLIWYPQ